MSLDEEVHAAPVAVVVHRRGERYEKHVVAARIKEGAFLLQDADHQVVDAVKADGFPQGRAVGEELLGQLVAGDADIAAALHVGIGDGAALLDDEVACRESLPRHPVQPDIRVGGIEARRGLIGAEPLNDADPPGEGGAGAELLELVVIQIGAARVFLPTGRPLEVDGRPLLDLGRVGPQPRKLILHVTLQGAHGGHDQNDGEDADEDAQKRQYGAEFVGGDGAKRHQDALADFG